MNDERRHKCRYQSCYQSIPVSMVLCSDHWKGLTTTLRTNLAAGVRRLEANQSDTMPYLRALVRAQLHLRGKGDG